MTLNPCGVLMRYGWMKLDKAAEITVWIFLIMDILGALHTIPLLLSFKRSHEIFDSFNTPEDLQAQHSEFETTNLGIHPILQIYKSLLLIKISKEIVLLANIVCSILALRYGIWSNTHSKRNLSLYAVIRFSSIIFIFSMLCYGYSLTTWVENNHLIFETRSLVDSTIFAIFVETLIILGNVYGIIVLFAFLSEHKFPLVFEDSV